VSSTACEQQFTYKAETLSECREELDRLFPLHYEEIALFRDRIRLEPDWPKYEQAENAGILKIFTVRAGGELVGYYVGSLITHPHYASHRMLFTDIFFLRSDYRRGLAGLDFLRAIREEAKRLGAEYLHIGTKLHHDLGALIERLGGQETDRLFIVPLLKTPL
jgi:hypothetical protein